MATKSCYWIIFLTLLPSFTLVSLTFFLDGWPSLVGWQYALCFLVLYLVFFCYRDFSSNIGLCFLFLFSTKLSSRIFGRFDSVAISIDSGLPNLARLFTAFT